MGSPRTFLPLAERVSSDGRPPVPVALLSVSRRLEGDQVLMRESDRSSCCWLVRTGALLVSVSSLAGRRGHLAVCGPGALVEGVDGAEIRALVASEVTRLTPTEFERDPAAARWLAAARASEVRLWQRRLGRTLTQRVPDRLADVLIELAETFGRPWPGGVRIELPLGQELLAGLVGATRESVNRALAELVRQGRVGRAGRSYVVYDRSSS